MTVDLLISTNVLQIRNWGTLLYMCGRTLRVTHQVAALFCVKWRRGRHPKSMMSNY